MKRITFVLILVASICCAGFAEEVLSANVKYKTTSGGFWCCGEGFCGGFGEFGINLLPEEKNFVLRDCLYIQGEGGSLKKNGSLEYGGVEIGDKLLIGGRYNCNGFIVRSYGFTGVSAGLFSFEGHKVFSLPVMLNLTFGGGFEFQFSEKMGFVIEFGGMNRLLIGGDKSVFEDFSRYLPVLTIGYRSFI